MVNFSNGFIASVRPVDNGTNGSAGSTGVNWDSNAFSIGEGRASQTPAGRKNSDASENSADDKFNDATETRSNGVGGKVERW